ncbi:unnamed protein product [Rhodiola kirilowii]
MEGGNLEKIIHDPAVDSPKWAFSNRLDICISVAEGLVYLHSGYGFPIVHCDMKPSNILLDGDFQAHVSDFGTARMLGIHSDGSETTSSSTSAFEGTIGYLAPEFAYMRKVTTKIDVFSFGVILMEILTKRRPTGLGDQNGSPYTLRQLVESVYVTTDTMSNRLVDVVDPALVLNDLVECEDAIHDVLKLALSCTWANPDARPNMDEVLSSLLKLRKDMG